MVSVIGKNKDLVSVTREACTTSSNLTPPARCSITDRLSMKKWKIILSVMLFVCVFINSAHFSYQYVKSIDIKDIYANDIPNTSVNSANYFATNYLVNGVKTFIQVAKALEPVTDKVTTHTYEIMYGRFLLPYYHQNPSMKILEIGLGCDMIYGPGASVNLWKKLFPQAEIWEAEYDAVCVKQHKNGTLKGINVLVGDQGNDTILDGWIEQSGGNFDVVIDDGGHQNCQIWQSFQKLWPTVKLGGLYFIEDMQVAKWNFFREYRTKTCDENFIVPEKLKDLFYDLMYDTSRKSDVEFMFCQSEACVLGKKK